MIDKTMKNTDIRSVNPKDLVERTEISIDTTAEKDERINEYIRKIKNPYCYMVGGIVVKVTFSDGEETIDDRLEAYARSMYK